MSLERLRIAFVGHVDHGKSSLIGRLLYDTGSVPPDKLEMIERAVEEDGGKSELAYLVDALKEEREQNITIDTAQVWLRTTEREYVIIDAPGHREFLHNMLTGASHAQAALLLLDAQEGIMEQTRRHAYLLTLLGIRRCIVIVNKMDLVDWSEERFNALQSELSPFLDQIGIEQVEFIPVSAREGDNVVDPSDNMDWYEGLTLLESMEELEVVPDAERPLRFGVQDVYDFEATPLVAGRVESGSLAQGDTLAVWPEGGNATVAAIERFPENGAPAMTGECVALKLDNGPVARRGQVFGPADRAPAVTQNLVARIYWMDEQPLNASRPLEAKIGSQSAEAKMESIGERIDSSTLEVLQQSATELQQTEVGEVRLSTSAPLVAEPAEAHPALGRIVLEQQGRMIGAGLILQTS